MSAEMNAVLLIASNSFNVCMQSDLYVLIWFKLGMMVDTNEYVNFTLLVC